MTKKKKKIKDIRKSIIDRMQELNVSIPELSTELGVPHSTISRYLNNQTQSIAILDQILTYLDLHICKS